MTIASGDVEQQERAALRLSGDQRAEPAEEQRVLRVDGDHAVVVHAATRRVRHDLPPGLDPVDELGGVQAAGERLRGRVHGPEDGS